MESVDFQKWLSELRGLPSSAAQWENARQFIDDATLIISEKETERNQIDELIGTIDDIAKRFSTNLEFLSIYDDLASLNATATISDIQRVEEALSKFENSLIEFGAFRDTNPPLAELIQAAEPVTGHFRVLEELLARHQPPKDTSEEITSDSGAQSEEAGKPTADNDSVSEPTEQGIADTSEKIDHIPEDLVHSDNGTNEDGEPASEDSTDTSSDNIETGGNNETEPSESDTFKQRPNGYQDAEVCPEDVAQPIISSPALEPITGEGDHFEPAVLSVLSDDDEQERLYGIEDSQEAAKRFLESSSLNDLETFMWSLVAADDLSAAYWVARHLDEQGHENVIPPELLKAVQGSRWLVPDSDRYVEDLAEFQSVYEDTNANSAQELLELAASLRSSLVAPYYSNMWNLLNTPAACPTAEPIVSVVGEFVRNGYALRPEYIESMGELARNQDEIVKASAAANLWLEETAPGKTHRFQLAREVWQHLISTGGIIGEMLAPVQRDDRAGVEAVKQKFDELSQNPENLLNETGRSLTEGSWRPINQHARTWLLNGIAEANDLAERWLEKVENQGDVREKAQDRFLIEQVTNLRSEIQRQSGQFAQALQELTTDSNPMDIASAAQCALRSTIQMLKVLDIHSDVDVPEIPIVVQDLTAINRSSGSHDLAAAVGRRLLWTDTVEIGDDGVWSGVSLEGESHALAKGVSESMPLEEAIKQRFHVQDFRFFDIMAEGRLSVERKEDLENYRMRAQEDSLLTLNTHLKQIEREVIQAARDGVIEIEDDNWILWYALELPDIKGAVESGDEILNYSPMSIRLQDIQKGIEHEETARQTQLQGEWDNEFSQYASFTPELQAWQDKFATARDTGNIRVMEECVTRLRNYSLDESLPDAASGLDDTEGNALSEFVAFVDSIPNIEEHARSGNGLSNLQKRMNP